MERFEQKDAKIAKGVSCPRNQRDIPLISQAKIASISCGNVPPRHQIIPLHEVHETACSAAGFGETSRRILRQNRLFATFAIFPTSPAGIPNLFNLSSSCAFRAFPDLRSSRSRFAVILSVTVMLI